MPVRRHKLGPTLPVLQPMIDAVRQPFIPLKNGPAMADHITALLDAVARALISQGLPLTANRKVLTAQQGSHRVDLRVVERSKRVPAAGASAKWRSFDLEPTGYLYVTTDGYVAWGPAPRRERLTWEEEVGVSTTDLARRVATDVLKIFEAEQHWDIAKAEQERRWAEKQAERARARQEAADLQAREERQEALLARVIAQAVKVRELRQYLAEVPQPRAGEEGYGRMLASLSSRLATLEQGISPDTIEAIIRAERFFPAHGDRKCLPASLSDTVP